MAIIGCSLSAQAQSPFDQVNPRDMQILKDLVIRMDKKIDLMRKEIKELKEKLDEQEDTTDNETNSFSTMSHRSSGPNLKALNKIDLPKDPSKEDVLKYLRKISAISQNQNSYSPSDLQVMMLKEIPSKHIETVLQFSDGLHIHIGYAIPSMIKEEHKDVAIENLVKNHNIVKAIVRYNWVDDAWKQLLNGLENKQYLPREWVNLVLQQNKEDGNKAILAYVAKNVDVNLFNNLKYSKVSKDELKKAILRNWEIKRYGHAWQATQSALCAVQYGNKDALALIFKTISSSDQNASYLKEQSIPIISQMLPYDGDIIKWYNKNKDSLVFDEEEVKFKLKK